MSLLTWSLQVVEEDSMSALVATMQPVVDKVDAGPVAQRCDRAQMPKVKKTVVKSKSKAKVTTEVKTGPCSPEVARVEYLKCIDVVDAVDGSGEVRYTLLTHGMLGTDAAPSTEGLNARTALANVHLFESKLQAHRLAHGWLQRDVYSMGRSFAYPGTAPSMVMTKWNGLHRRGSASGGSGKKRVSPTGVFDQLPPTPLLTGARQGDLGSGLEAAAPGATAYALAVSSQVTLTLAQTLDTANWQKAVERAVTTADPVALGSLWAAGPVPVNLSTDRAWRETLSELLNKTATRLSTPAAVTAAPLAAVTEYRALRLHHVKVLRHQLTSMGLQ